MTTTTTMMPPTPTPTSTSPSLHRAHHRKNQRQYQPEDADQAIVQTPYGRGLVIRTRKSDGIKEIQLLEWETFAKKPKKKKTLSSSDEPFMLYTPKEYPSVQPHVGDDVICQYGRGRVTKISIVDSSSSSSSSSGDEYHDTSSDKNQTAAPKHSKSTPQKTDQSSTQKQSSLSKPPLLKYTIALTSWRLHTPNTPVTIHLTNPPPRVVRPQTLSEMDAHSKISHAQTQKNLANIQFSQQKNYKLALQTYAEAVNAVRNVQHDHSSTNYVRAELVVVMVTCSNNAGTCCVRLGGGGTTITTASTTTTNGNGNGHNNSNNKSNGHNYWDEGKRFAQNALILLDALHQKRGKNIHSILNTKLKLIDAKLFGEWRIKSYLIIGRCILESGKEDEDVALGVLKKGWEIGKGYLDGMGDKGCNCKNDLEKASYKVLMGQLKEVRKLMAECVERKKKGKEMEKKRAKAMFCGGGGSGSDVETKEDTKQSDATTPSTAENAIDETESQQDATKNNNKNNNNENPKVDFQDLPKQDRSIFRSANHAPPSSTSSDNVNGNNNNSNDDRRAPYRKKVSFSEHPPQIKEFQKDIVDAEYEDEPWYAEHKEALIMMGIAGFSVVALLGLRKAFR